VCVDTDPDDVEPGNDVYLVADLGLSCTSEKYRFGRTWALAMIFVYPIVSKAQFYFNCSVCS
jgi:hypothetical protein